MYAFVHYVHFVHYTSISRAPNSPLQIVSAIQGNEVRVRGAVVTYGDEHTYDDDAEVCHNMMWRYAM